MRKTVYLFLALIFSILTIQSNSKAETTPQDGWEPTVICQDGYHSAYEHKAMGLYQAAGDSNDEENFQQTKNYCINDNVSSIMDSDIFGTKIAYCENPNKIGYIDVENKYASETLITALICCPKDLPYLRNNLNYTNVCCSIKVGSLDTNALDPPYSCGRDKNNGNIVWGRVPEFSGLFPLSTLLLKIPFSILHDDGFACPEDYCMTKGNNILVQSNNAKDRTVTSKTNGQCLSFLEDANKSYCVDGKSVSKEDFENYKALGPGAINVCNDFIDTNEKSACIACYKNCTEADTCSYSSLGCIQTTVPGVTTRIFQIGLGVVGALAIVRFIQAALLRQTADPSKIQESYDIITSVIIGIVVLLGSMVILNFVGKDILQMIPF